MNEKKKPLLSAVWNQMDGPPIREELPSSASAQQKILLKSNERIKEHCVEQSADQRAFNLAFQKCTISSKSQSSQEHSANAYSRPSNYTKTRNNSKTVNAADECKNLASQKIFNSGFQRHHKSSNSLYADNKNIEYRNRASQQSSQAANCRFSVQTKGRNYFQAGNNNHRDRNCTSQQSSQVNYNVSSLHEKKNDSSHIVKMHNKKHTCDARNIDSQNCKFEENKQKYFSNHSRIVKPITFIALKELVTKQPTEILLTICSKNCSFMLLLAQKNIRIDMMALVLIVLGKACSADMKQTLATFLNTIRGKTDFLLISIQTFLVSLRQKSVEDYHLESLSHLLVFLQKFQHTLPSSSSDFISMLLPLVRRTCENFLIDHNSYIDDMYKLKEIEEQNEYIIDQHAQSEIRVASKKRDTLQVIEPPENFRALPVLPNVDDIYSNAFLRPNIVEGKYINTEHYLDVQYRLLREDYVRPLREGIAEYLRTKGVGSALKKCKDVQVYENVHVVKQEFANGRMLHIVQLSGNFSRIRWEYSKRFLSGSLLCLSSDDFKSMLFASVARRIPDQLSKGLLLIRFEEITDEVINISPLRSFVVIETSAYFEAYRYNLKALHELNEDVLPLKKYIVDVETAVDHPHYLDHSTKFDVRPLLIPLNSTNIKRISTADGDIEFQYEFPADISDKKLITILNDSCWPTASDLSLDDSQYLALKAAITKEFAIIQGPPGTGKTYIGLRIAQLFLYNMNKWLMKEINSLPILVVCFTNHALDQFLEGMMCFTNKIVRIGGRGSNDAVSKFQLNYLKKNAIKNKEFPKYISVRLFHHNQEVKSTKGEIDRVYHLVQKCLKNILGEIELKKYIPIIHYISLKNIVNSLEFLEHGLTDDGLIIYDWLGIRSRLEWSDFEMALDVKDNAKNPVEDSELVPLEFDDADAESVDEADIEYIEAQRDIDTEDFTDVSFDIEDPEKEFVLPDDSGWQVQGGRKQRSKFIKKCLNDSKPLEKSEAMKITDVWKLSLQKRWDLYKFWLQEMISDKQQETMILQAQLKKQYEELYEMRTEEDIFILQSAHVVGMTTTGAAKYRDIVQRLNPQILIIEEAAEILESHIVTSLAPNTQHVILIGDHQQLRPSPTVHVLAVKYDLNISLFERMIKNKMDCFKLSLQHRMRPDITDLIVPHIYKDLKNHESVTKYESIKGVSKNMYFVTHNYIELQEKESKSKINEHEARFLIKLCNYFIQQGYDSSQLTILTTYTGQLYVMKKIVRANKMFQNVRITVVDNYQGEENDIILISFVRSNEEGEIGFLKIANRVCVALSRAKKGLFCIGNFELLAEKSELWKNITKTLQQKKAIGPSLQLLCQNHPKVCNVVATEKDFESVPEGGCTKVCEYRLSCGHSCSLMCHPYDKMHENIRCYKKCNNSCKEGHACPKKCYEDCGTCTLLVSKKMFPCGHTIRIACSKQNSEVKCYADCNKNLKNCDHKCRNKCSDVCTVLCKEIISIKSPVCGHIVKVNCHLKSRPEELKRLCNNPCNVILDCGHKCNGTCSRCHQGRLHVACKQPCKRILVCGHECKFPCAKSCPPCEAPCENKCNHSKCPKNCGEPCDMCKETCQWCCPHKICSRLCGEMCNHVPCNEICHQTLSCGHPCIGFCGEPCPEECRICNSDTVKEIFFGTEDDDDARFVQLEDCKHILEISGLNEWMSVEEKDSHQIQMKVCPKCKTVIRTNLRFGNIVKDCLEKIEKVKRKVFGNVECNKQLQKSILRCLRENASVLSDLKFVSIPIYESWKRFLASEGCKSIQEITTIENVVRISLELAEVRVPFPSFVEQDAAVKERLSVLTKFVAVSEDWLFSFMYDKVFTASEQQLKELSSEIHRLKLCYKLLKFMNKCSIKMPNFDFEKCISVLTDNIPFGENSAKIFCDSFKALAKNSETAVLNISDMEKQSILKAMNLSVGHWFQCPNGHVYCITECGGAMEEARCNECKDKIGGTNHRLLATNRVATDMDGARHSVWSSQMNLRNYQLEFND